MSDSWYLPADDYYVPAEETAQTPLRQGDVFGPVKVDGDTWIGAQLIQPTCDLAKKSVTKLQIARVHRFSDIHPSDHPRVATGWSEDDGRIQVAMANTFFLAPIPSVAGKEPLFSDLRETHRIPRAALEEAGRAAAMTHDCRVMFIRRLLYFQFRWLVTVAQVRDLEAQRIRSDAKFAGPRPAWAQEESSPPAQEERSPAQ